MKAGWVVEEVVMKGKLPQASAVAAEDQKLGTAKAPRAQMNNFVKAVRDGQMAKSDPRASDPKVWRRILQEATLC